MANLLLATVNFEHCNMKNFHKILKTSSKRVLCSNLTNSVVVVVEKKVVFLKSS